MLVGRAGRSRCLSFPTHCRAGQAQASPDGQGGHGKASIAVVPDSADRRVCKRKASCVCGDVRLVQEHDGVGVVAGLRDGAPLGRQASVGAQQVVDCMQCIDSTHTVASHLQDAERHIRKAEEERQLCCMSLYTGEGSQRLRKAERLTFDAALQNNLSSPACQIRYLSHDAGSQSCGARQ